jgi:hypothetical protein
LFSIILPIFFFIQPSLSLSYSFFYRVTYSYVFSSSFTLYTLYYRILNGKFDLNPRPFRTTLRTDRRNNTDAKVVCINRVEAIFIIDSVRVCPSLRWRSEIELTRLETHTGGDDDDDDGSSNCTLQYIIQYNIIGINFSPEPVSEIITLKCIYNIMIQWNLDDPNWPETKMRRKNMIYIKKLYFIIIPTTRKLIFWFCLIT